MKKISFFLFSIHCSLLLFAQQDATNVEITINAGNRNWYDSAWLWIIVAAVFILLLVALTRGKKE